jgi:hypothetical protein
MDEEDSSGKKLAATVPERTPEGRFPKGTSGNAAGRPLGAATRFSRELREAFGEHFNSDAPGANKTKGLDAMERVWKEKPDAYLALAVKLIPQEVRVQEGHIDQLSDSELIAVVVASRKTSE